MEFIVTEADRVFGDRPRQPYLDAIRAVEKAALEQARTKLEGQQPAGFVPDEGEFAPQTLRPYFFNDNAGNQLTGSFRQNIGSTGWQDVFAQTDLSDSGVISADFVMGIVGLALLEPTQRYSEIRLERGDTTLPVINVEDVRAMETPALLWEIDDPEDAKNFVFDEDSDLTLRANMETTGDVRLKPIGVAYVPHSEAITEAP